MIRHIDISDKDLGNKIRRAQIRIGGHRRLKIYGTLTCASGKRMKRENRVFFGSEEEATANGYRPCGGCMREGYRSWKLEKWKLESGKWKVEIGKWRLEKLEIGNWKVEIGNLRLEI